MVAPQIFVDDPVEYPKDTTRRPIHLPVQAPLPCSIQVLQYQVQYSDNTRYSMVLRV